MLQRWSRSSGRRTVGKSGFPLSSPFGLAKRAPAKLATVATGWPLQKSSFARPLRPRPLAPRPSASGCAPKPTLQRRPRALAWSRSSAGLPWSLRRTRGRRPRATTGCLKRLHGQHVVRVLTGDGGRNMTRCTSSQGSRVPRRGPGADLIRRIPRSLRRKPDGQGTRDRRPSGPRRRSTGRWGR